MSAPTVTQLDVRVTMAHLGGYWPASASMLRLLEELGEVAELLERQHSKQLASISHEGDVGSMPVQPPPGDDDAALAEELADVWIISTVVADQYLAAVAPLSGSEHGDRGSTAPRPPATPRFEDLVAAAGEIARVVNYYDGPKSPRSSDGWTGMQPAIAGFHGALRAFASVRGADLAAAVAHKLERSRAVDTGRFVQTFDASTAPVLERLRTVRPDLAEARLLGAPDWPAGPPEIGLAAVLPVISTYRKAAEAERLDGLVIPLPPARSASGGVEAGAGSAGGFDDVLLELRRALVGHADAEAHALGDVLANELLVELVELGDDRAVLVRYEELHRLGGL